jgi:hypothetical protein
VLVRLVVPQPPALGEGFHHLRVRFEDLLSSEQPDIVQEASIGPDGSIDLEPVFLAGVEVVRAVPRRGVHDPGALLERDVVGQDGKRVAGVQGMSEVESLEALAFHSHQRIAQRLPGRRADASRELLGDQDGRAVPCIGAVSQFRMKRDGEIRRNRPRRGRPDQRLHVLSGQLRQPTDELTAARLGKRERDVDRG